jgi:glycosyltransferase involved in cell wall biosynthesis
MLLSVIVPAFNEEKCIAQCLRSIRAACEGAAAREDFQHETIVVDNNSTDRTAELARADGATVIFEPKNQIARARNRGAEAARGDWFLFVDADSVLSEELLLDMVRVMREGKVVGGGCLCRFPDGARKLLRNAMRFWNWISRTFRLAAGSTLFCRADYFREAGAFNERVYASEELGLSQRLKRLGRNYGKEFVILTRYPMLTSARKGDLYTAPAFLRFLLFALASPWTTFRNPKRCHMWYDGRR